MVFGTLLHTSTMSQTIPDMQGYSEIFQCRRECHYNGSSSRKKSPFDSFEGLRAPKKPKVPFCFENTCKNDIPSIATGKNLLGPREYPGRLVTLSKCGFRARCPKLKPCAVRSQGHKSNNWSSQAPRSTSLKIVHAVSQEFG